MHIVLGDGVEPVGPTDWEDQMFALVSPRSGRVTFLQRHSYRHEMYWDPVPTIVVQQHYQ